MACPTDTPGRTDGMKEVERLGCVLLKILV